MPHVLDPSDIANRPDDKSMSTFLGYALDALGAKPLQKSAPVKRAPKAAREPAQKPQYDNAMMYSHHSNNTNNNRPQEKKSVDPSLMYSHHSNNTNNNRPQEKKSVDPSLMYSHHSNNTNNNRPQEKKKIDPALMYSHKSYNSNDRPPTEREQKEHDENVRLYDYSSDVEAKYPGRDFETIRIDGRSEQGQSPCWLCKGTLGDGVAYKTRINREDRLIHSRCFECSSCKLDIRGSYWYEDGRLFCKNCFLEHIGFKCFKCDEIIKKWYVNALDNRWHEKCYSCKLCGVGFPDGKFFSKDGFPYCSKDYAKSNGQICAACGEGAPSAIEALGKLWHRECFKCPQCNKGFDGGFFNHNGRPYHDACLKIVEGGGSGEVGSYGGGEKAFDDQDQGEECCVCYTSIPFGEGVKALGKRYCANCFVCADCGTQLKDQFVSQNGEPYCNSCADKQQAPPPVSNEDNCVVCNKKLVGRVLKAMGREYHADCFGCATCGAKFPDGSFYEKDGWPVCENCA